MAVGRYNGDQRAVYLCPVCKKLRSAAVFPLEETMCRPCRLELCKENGTSAPSIRKNSDTRIPQANRLRKMGLDDATHVRMYQAQGRRCAICHFEPADRFDLAIDHDHKTGRVRGLLCRQCNTGLGSFRDNTEALERAIAYLQVDRSDAPLIHQPKPSPPRVRRVHVLPD